MRRAGRCARRPHLTLTLTAPTETAAPAGALLHAPCTMRQTLGAVADRPRSKRNCFDWPRSKGNHWRARAGLALPGFPEHAVSVRYATEHRCGVAVRGPRLSDAISGTDPLKDGRPLQVPRPPALLQSGPRTFRPGAAALARRMLRRVAGQGLRERLAQWASEQVVLSRTMLGFRCAHAHTQLALTNTRHKVCGLYYIHF